MLALVFLFLVALLVSSFAIWLYRRIPEIQSLISELFSQSDSAPRSQDGLQQFMSSVSTPGSITSNYRGGKARSTKLRRSRGELKVPWGW